MVDPLAHGRTAHATPAAGIGLQELVARCVLALEEEGEAAAERLLAEHVELAAEARAQLEILRGLGVVPGGVPAMLPERLGGFRLIEKLGSGGMGAIYRAEDPELGREVALKVIRPDLLARSESRERFRREVLAVAALQHPNIVQVHSVGVESGIPYFAMELVEGCTLTAALVDVRSREHGPVTGADLHRAVLARTAGTRRAAYREASYVFAGTWTDACLRIVLQAADALSHAHQCGIIHRDVKPSNLMITPAGRVLLLDFGLASSSSLGTLTRTGAQLGTIAYMPPERLRDTTTSADVRGDVYSLGVTLYELLTRRLPFATGSAAATILRILEGLPTRPRAIDPAIGAEAEVVCLAAMDLDPRRRYASAADFARDVENVLARRPVDVRPAGAAERLALWVRRNPARAAATAFGLIALVGTPSALWLQQHFANRKLSSALGEAEKQRDRARKGVALAARSIEQFLGRVGDDALDEIPELEPVRRELLEQSLALDRELAALGPEGEVPGQRVALDQCRLGQVLVELGRQAEAVELYDGAVAKLRELPRSERNAGEYEQNLATALAWRAVALRDLGRFDESLRDDEEALSFERERAHENELLTDDRFLETVSAHAAGTLFSLGRVEEAIVRQQGAVAYARELARGTPSELNQLQLGAICCALGHFLLVRGRHEEARPVLEESIEVQSRLVTTRPSAVKARKGLLDARTNLVELHYEVGDLDRMEQEARAAFDLAATLVRDFPATPDYALGLSQCRTNLAIPLAADPRRRDQALELLQQDCDAMQALVASHPGVLEYRAGLAVSYGNVGEMVIATDAERAREWLERGIAEHDALLAAAPDHPSYRSHCAAQAITLAQVFVLLGRAHDAVGAARRAAALDPSAVRLRQAVGKLLQSAALLLEGEQSPDDSSASMREAWVEEAEGLLDRAVDAGFSDTDDLLNAATLGPLRARPAWDALLFKATERAAIATE